VLIDCDTCDVRGPACGDCVVSVLLGPPPTLELDASEQAAIDVLAASGLVPPLRLVPKGTGKPGKGLVGRRRCAAQRHVARAVRETKKVGYTRRSPICSCAECPATVPRERSYTRRPPGGSDVPAESWFVRRTPRAGDPRLPGRIGPRALAGS
jgi:hypothetical protein